MYPKGNNLIIQAFTDTDWAGSIDDRKSTSGATFYLGGCLVSWLSKKQTSISLYTSEAEYIAVATCCAQVLWMKQTLQDLQVQFSDPIPVFCDNTNSISISKNHAMHSKKNTFRSNIILLENKSLKRISNLNMLVQKNKSLISSLNLYLKMLMSIL